MPLYDDPVNEYEDAGMGINPWVNQYLYTIGTQTQPPAVTIGDPRYQIPGASDPSIIGSVDVNGIHNYDFGQNAPIDPAHGSLGPNNPTIYGASGGLWGSGIDLGIPGIASIGGIGSAIGLGGLLGMDSPGYGLGGAVGVDTGGSGGLLGLGKVAFDSGRQVERLDSLNANSESLNANMAAVLVRLSSVEARAEERDRILRDIDRRIRQHGDFADDASDEIYNRLSDLNHKDRSTPGDKSQEDAP